MRVYPLTGALLVVVFLATVFLVFLADLALEATVLLVFLTTLEAFLVAVVFLEADLLVAALAEKMISIYIFKKYLKNIQNSLKSPSLQRKEMEVRA